MTTSDCGVTLSAQLKLLLNPGQRTPTFPLPAVHIRSTARSQWLMYCIDGVAFTCFWSSDPVHWASRLVSQLESSFVGCCVNPGELVRALSSLCLLWLVLLHFRGVCRQVESWTCTHFFPFRWLRVDSCSTQVIQSLHLPEISLFLIDGVQEFDFISSCQGRILRVVWVRACWYLVWTTLKFWL